MATNSAVNLKTATSGKLVQAQGVGSPNDFTTATFPSTAGAVGNVLTSDGTNWQSSPAGGGGLLFASGTLTNAQIKALHGTPVQAIAAPGSGNVIVVVNAVGRLIYGGTDTFTASSSQVIGIYYGTANNTLANTGATGLLSNGSITSNSNQFNSIMGPSAGAGQLNYAYTAVNNVAVNLYNPVATEITGNAANNNTIAWGILYYIAAI